jgi:sec-independent protein translocase protein TatA
MPGGLGTTESQIVFGIVVLLFGAVRIGKLARELGMGIRAFRKGMEGAGEESADAGY